MKKLLSTFGLLAVIIAGSYLSGAFDGKDVSAAVYGGSNATTTYSFGPQSVGNFKVLKTGAGILQKIVITNETAGTFNVYDATSTNHGDHPTTTIAVISPSLAEGTYDFEVAVTRGIMIEFQSANVASSTITWD